MQAFCVTGWADRWTSNAFMGHVGPESRNIQGLRRSIPATYRVPRRAKSPLHEKVNSNNHTYFWISFFPLWIQGIPFPHQLHATSIYINLWFTMHYDKHNVPDQSEWGREFYFKEWIITLSSWAMVLNNKIMNRPKWCSSQPLYYKHKALANTIKFGSYSCKSLI